MQTKDQKIKDFAVNLLGCGCPDEVFLNIVTGQELLAEFDSLSLHRILIGNRLLIYIVSPAQVSEQKKLLSVLVEKGVNERETNGYNRLRVVFYPLESVADSNELTAFFNELDISDDRTFLHLLEKKDVAEIIG